MSPGAQDVEVDRDDFRSVQDTANRALSRIEAHEGVCAERYTNLLERLKWLTWGVLALLAVTAADGKLVDFFKMFAK